MDCIGQGLHHGTGLHTTKDCNVDCLRCQLHCGSWIDCIAYKHKYCCGSHLWDARATMRRGAILRRSLTVRGAKAPRRRQGAEEARRTSINRCSRICTYAATRGVVCWCSLFTSRGSSRRTTSFSASLERERSRCRRIMGRFEENGAGESAPREWRRQRRFNALRCKDARERETAAK